MMTRREALKTTALLATAAAVPAAFAQEPFKMTQPLITTQPPPSGPFTVPPLPYPFDALEPHIDAQTMQIHHDKHHAAYVANLNKAIADAPENARESLAKESAETLLMNLNSVPEKIRTAVRNNGGGHYNHSLFWQMMKKGGGGEPGGDLAKAIAAKFKSFGAFKDEFSKAALGQFGSGWAWLVYNPRDKSLSVEPTPNQDSPRSQNHRPLLGIDVWEHAYYLKYQNRRADYIAAWWNVVNWDFVADQFSHASKA